MVAVVTVMVVLIAVDVGEAMMAVIGTELRKVDDGTG